ncbi:hypothetical protein L593_11720 [Salinarchaeum sp. Harcht-Bsk1]|uniref:hypothetical protein n=1 Tax=Salinarchaeum sp. Harcht-Bsk1 TaxID=1333523 RepID=UPI0003424998|nr:hypothetical protein [Salinarchaeum sp. Harcht-Bsk1]AGN02287.1 hypothetical protein L593_11720 [Salinarchaeum sp. Harcht-Bsk1]
MPLKPEILSDEQFLHELAGITGLGWTASTLGFIGSLIWYGDAPGGSHPLESRVLLYLGICCFVATIGLDALRTVLDDAGE